MSQKPRKVDHEGDRSLIARVGAFQRITVKHRKLEEALESLLAYLFNEAEEGIICIIGPTGVGKTTLRKLCITAVLAHEISAMDEDRGYIPIMEVEARAPERGNFDWATFYRDSLVALQEPLVDRKILTKEDSAKVRAEGNGAPGFRSLLQYRIALDNALKFRHVKYFLIDEAQTLLKVSSARLAGDQMDTIKSRASLTGVQHALIGTYELLNTGDLSAQLSRRRRNIHLPRYDCDNAADLEEFISVIHTFQSRLPLPCSRDLVESADFLYAKTLGCVGILKTWLNGVVSTAAQLGATKITIKDLERKALPNRDLMTMLAEIREGEDQFAGPSDTTLMAELGLKKSPHSNENGADATQVTDAAKTPRRRPGQRRPTRDPIGRSAIA
ncbi:MAG TPA: AAA family ATPase [Acidiferrobacter sp.]|nr:AAA family ATPase [Acidiferrobacter sp.]